MNAPNMTLPEERFAEKLAEARAIVSQNHGRRGGKEVALLYSEAMDQVLATIAEAIIESRPEFEALRSRLAIIATGGYGRRELNLFSDVDVIFLLKAEPTPLEEEFIKAFLYPCWNLKVDLGYSLKTQREVLEGVAADLDLATAVIGIHTVWGEAQLARALENEVRTVVRMKFSDRILQMMTERAGARHEKYGHTRLLLEPNIKESPGSLRDIHQLLWLAYVHYGEASLSALSSHGLVNTREERLLRRAHSFLIELRNGLHLLESRKIDVLNFERQMRIAPRLGFVSKDHALPEEQLMRTYYEHTGAVERLARRVMRRLSLDEQEGETGGRRRLRRTRLEGEFWTRDDQVWVDPREAATVTRSPQWMMHLFRLTTVHGLFPDEFTLDLVESRLGDVDDDYRASAVNREEFLFILRHPTGSGRTLRAMHQTGFLDAYIPEFALVRNLPRIDYYHQFTVDEHLLRSVDCANNLMRPGHPTHRSHAGAVARQILRWDLLALALLLHDVGKGEGRGHVIRGAHIIQRVADRMGFSKVESDVLYNLVANHQRMSHVALQRNAEDPKVAEELARSIGDAEILRMLYVHTCCDLRAVSHDSWNDWRGSLLASLYENVAAVLTGRDDQLRRDAPPCRVVVEQVLKLKENGTAAAAGDPAQSDELTRDDLEEFLQDMPSRYRLHTPAEQIARHVVLSNKLSDSELVQWELDVPEGASYAVLNGVTRDAPGIFCQICGALASRGLNILSAQIYTAKNGVCVDVFQIQDADGRPPTDPMMFERLRNRLNRVLKGEREGRWVEHLSKRAKPVSIARLDMRPPSVTISNDETKDAHTVLEVKTPDRPGLLFDIATVFQQHRINVHLALIMTESYQVVDVFYVTDWENNRLEPGPRTEALQRDLLAISSPSPESALGVSMLPEDLPPEPC